MLFITAHGSLDASIRDMGVTLRVTVGEQTLPNGKIVPSIAVKEAVVDLPKDQISLDLHGDLIMEFASLFKSLFINTVREDIVREIRQALETQVPPAVNGLIADQKGETMIYQGLDLDWSINSPPQIQLLGTQ